MRHRSLPARPTTAVELICRTADTVERLHWARETRGGLTLDRALDRAVEPDDKIPLNGQHLQLIEQAKEILSARLAAPFKGDLQAWEEGTTGLTETEVAVELRHAAGRTRLAVVA